MKLKMTLQKPEKRVLEHYDSIMDVGTKHGRASDRAYNKACDLYEPYMQQELQKKDKYIKELEEYIKKLKNEIQKIKLLNDMALENFNKVRYK